MPWYFLFWNLLEGYLFKKPQRNLATCQDPLFFVIDDKIHWSRYHVLWFQQGEQRGEERALVGRQQSPLTLRNKSAHNVCALFLFAVLRKYCLEPRIKRKNDREYETILCDNLIYLSSIYLSSIIYIYNIRIIWRLPKNTKYPLHKKSALGCSEMLFYKHKSAHQSHDVGLA